MVNLGNPQPIPTHYHERLYIDRFLLDIYFRFSDLLDFYLIFSTAAHLSTKVKLINMFGFCATSTGKCGLY